MPTKVEDVDKFMQDLAAAAQGRRPPDDEAEAVEGEPSEQINISTDGGVFFSRTDKTLRWEVLESGFRETQCRKLSMTLSPKESAT